MKGYSRIHSYATCQDCSWSYTDITKNKHKHDTGRKAQEHADKTGHRAYVEIGLRKYYERGGINIGICDNPCFKSPATCQNCGIDISTDDRREIVCDTCDEYFRKHGRFPKRRTD